MSQNDEYQKVIIRGLQIPFLDLVSFLVKLALAAIPAGILLGFFVLMWVAFISQAVKS